MDYEREHMFEKHTFERKLEINSPFPCFQGGKNCLLIETGISKTNASAAAQWAFDHIEAERYINVGLVGSLTQAHHYGDVLIAEECRFHDVDIRPFFSDHKLGQIPACTLSRYPLQEVELEGDLPRARVISGDLFVTNHQVLREIITEYSPDCVDMEIAAIAHVAYLHNKLGSLASIKVISDKADASATEDFYTEERLFHTILPITKRLVGEV